MQIITEVLPASSSEPQMTKLLVQRIGLGELPNQFETIDNFKRIKIVIIR